MTVSINTISFRNANFQFESPPIYDLYNKMYAGLTRTGDRAGKSLFLLEGYILVYIFRTLT